MQNIFSQPGSTLRRKLKNDQEGIFRRYLREKKHWDAHLKRTHKYMLTHLQGNRQETLAVLGSGWLLDVPLDALIKRFSTIFLVDIRHPAQVYRKYRNHPAIVFIRADITGGAVQEIQTILKGKKQPGQAAFSVENMLEHFPQQPDKWVSVNLLNQLDMLLVSQLEKKHGQDSLFPLRQRIQQDHLDFLTKRTSLLITDYKQMLVDNQEAVHEQQSLVHVPVPQGKDPQEWLWKFDTQKTYHPRWQTHFKVLARNYL